MTASAKDVSAHLRSLFVQTADGAGWNALERFPHHGPPPETMHLLESYLSSPSPIDVRSPSLGSSTSHSRAEETREREAKVLRDGLLECWEAINPWKHSSAASPSTEHAGSEVSAFLLVLSTLLTADPSPFPASDINDVWWPRCLRRLLSTDDPPNVASSSLGNVTGGGSSAVAALKAELEQAKAPGERSRAGLMQAVAGRGRSRSRSASRPAVQPKSVPASTSVPLGNDSASLADLRLSRAARSALSALLAKGLSAKGRAGNSMVSALWDVFATSDAPWRSTRPGRVRGNEGSQKKWARGMAETVLMRWARSDPKAFFNRASEIVGGSASAADSILAALTLVASFVRSFPQLTHHLLSTSLLPTLIWILVAPWSSSSPPASFATLRRAASRSPTSSASAETVTPFTTVDDEKAIATLVVGLLAMILPRIPTSVEPFLDSILVAFARAACWKAEHDAARADEASWRAEHGSRSASAEPHPRVVTGLEDFVGPYGVDQVMSRTASVQQRPSSPVRDSQRPANAASPVAPGDSVVGAAEPIENRTFAASASQTLLAEEMATADDAHLPFLSTATELFTVLYGLFPCNLVDFLRHPKGYLDHQGWGGRMMIDAVKLRAAALPMLRLHTLSPALLVSTAENERRTSKTRLAVLETADLTAEFERNLVVPRLGGGMSIMDEYAGLLKPVKERVEDTGGIEDDGAEGGEEETPRGRTSSTAPRPLDPVRSESTPPETSTSRSLASPATISPAPPVATASSPRSRSRRSQPDPADAILSTYVALKAATRTPSESVSRTGTRGGGASSHPASRRSSAHSRSAAADEFRMRASSLRPAVLEEAADEDGADREGAGETVQQLLRENLMLRNELNFELYLKSQHLQQMGTLHKEHVRESGLEAEVQNLQTVNRALRRKLEAASRRSEELRDAHAHRKVGQISYTESLKDRSAKYRDEKKAWIEERAALKARVEEQEDRLRTQAKELETGGQRLLDLEFELQSIQPRLASVENLEQKNKDLTKSLLVWDDDLRRFREQKQQMDVLAAEWKKAEMLASSGQQENDDLRAALRAEEDRSRSLQAQFDALTARMNAVGAMRARVSSSASAKAAERARSEAARSARREADGPDEVSAHTNGLGGSHSQSEL